MVSATNRDCGWSSYVRARTGTRAPLQSIARSNNNKTVMKPASGIPSWALAVSLIVGAGATYAYVLKQIGPNLNDQLEAEAARQDALERRQQQQQQQQPAAAARK
jgi:uncharacterized protein HemX